MFVIVMDCVGGCVDKMVELSDVGHKDPIDILKEYLSNEFQVSVDETTKNVDIIKMSDQIIFKGVEYSYVLML